MITAKVTAEMSVRSKFMKILNFNKFRRHEGFTLLEIVVVIGILAILSSSVLVFLNPFEQFKKAEDAKRRSDLSQIQKSLESYYNDHARYPAVDASTHQIYAQSSGQNPVIIDWGTSWSPYMTVLPKDPSYTKNYVYYASADGQTYYIFASLDRGVNDPQACNKGNACLSLPTLGLSGTSCGATCNYGVSSPNVSP